MTGGPVVVMGRFTSPFVAYKCRFDLNIVPATWLNESAITCNAPSTDVPKAVDVRVSGDGGLSYFRTAPPFSYIGTLALC